MLYGPGHSRYFYYVLGSVLFVHLFFLAIRLKPFTHPIQKKALAIKLKIIKETKLSDILTKRQIVQSEESEKLEKKKDAYLSDRDRSFDRQTRAKAVDIFKKTAKGSRSLSSMTKVSQSRVKNLKLSDIGIGNQPTQLMAGRSPSSITKEGTENGNIKDTGSSATNDYVEEVKLGDFTHLNTVEYKYYGFFHRIRQKLEQFWGKGIQEKSMALFRSGRTIASQDYVTSLQVTLNARGEIVAVKILGASGIRELDDAAVESFNQAGPFPNPPKDLLVNGEATIQWGFVVKS
jgi:TonB family protein